MQRKVPVLRDQRTRVHVHLTVSELKASIDFYVTKLGLFYDHGVRETAWLSGPGVLLSLSIGEPAPNRQCFFGFSLPTPDALREQQQLLQRAGVVVGEIEMAGADRAHFFAYDPDGYPLLYSYIRLEYPDRESGKL